ncbi:MAG TPA: AAA family ATPase, partial [Acidimicrobiia bacterium]|nr:AAA family ATPase [Acidimicrobiia bacterium]
MAGEWRLVGRNDEIRFLQRLVAGGELPGIVLAGAAGVGKTRLAAELLVWAEETGLATARVVATPSTRRLPFGALAPLLPATPGTDLAVQAAAGPYGPTIGEPGSPSNWGALLRMLAAALLEPAGGRRLVLFVDDAHQLDDPSATLIHQLTLTGSCFVLATIRTGEPAPGPVTALWKDGLVERRELEGLKISAVEEVLVTSLGGEVDAAAVNQLWSRCQGNMLFLRELVLGARRDGSLRREGGIWRLAGSSPPPERLVELVEARLAGLGDEERALLEVVSFGEPLGPAELGGVADPALAESLERQGLIVTGRNGRRLELRLAHPLYGEVLRSRVPRLRIPAIARSLAEVVEATGARRREDTLRVATWRLDGGGAQPDLMLAAATIARWRYAVPLAERLAQAAIDAGAGFEAALLVALLAGLQGRTDEAGRRMAALADQATGDAERGRLAVARIDNYVFYTGCLEEGLRIAEEAEAAITDPSWRDEIAARRCGLVLGVEGPAAAVEVAEPLLERASGAALGMAGHLGAYCLGRLGRLTAAREAAQRVGA